MNVKEEALALHEKVKGKLEIVSKVSVRTAKDLTLAYSPGVAEPCRKIAADTGEVYRYTGKGNMVAIVSDGTAVLGLGDIGAEAALPVMEGKAVLFKSFGGVDAFPICLNSKEPEEIIATVKMLEPSFGGINLEDIAAPNCFYIEKRLKEEMNIPVFHDDQHGTAVIVLAGLINAAKIVGKELKDLSVVFNGSGAAGIAIFKLLHSVGIRKSVLCDRTGAIYQGRKDGMNAIKEEIAAMSNPEKKKGSLAEVIRGADVFIGVSSAKMVTPEMVRSMAQEPIIFALANPEPEIRPEEAKAAGAKVIGTGRSDYPNQINNVLAFPGIFRGALDVKAAEINEEMKLAAAYALADLVEPEKLNSDYIIPEAFDLRVAEAVAKAVARAALESGAVRKS